MRSPVPRLRRRHPRPGSALIVLVVAAPPAGARRARPGRAQRAPCRGARCSRGHSERKTPMSSHRARLRVEMGRLRTVLRTLAGVSATKRGFALVPRRAREVVVLARPVEEQHAAVLAFLADGKSWSSSALALALGASQRTVQRALDSLAAAGKVQSPVAAERVVGRHRPCRDSRRRCCCRRRCRVTISAGRPAGIEGWERRERYGLKISAA